MKNICIAVVCLFVCVTFNHDIQGYQPTTPAKQGSTQSDYDPLDVSEDKIETLELTIEDETRERKIPLLVYLPNRSQAAEVILFSHGLGSSRRTSKYLAEHWAERGYIAVFMQHHGSDDLIWKDVPLLKRPAALKKAISVENSKLRVEDVPVVIDHLQKWNRQSGHPLRGRMNMKKIGMSGHSFGAITTQYLGGQTFEGKTAYADDRITACLLMSPNAPLSGDVKQAYSQVKLPWLSMTGTKDKIPIGGIDVEDRLAVYQALPVGDKYELVLYKAEHSAFTDSKYGRFKPKRNPNHHVAVKAISTAFWDAYLRDDAPAKKWLTTDAARSVLETKDRWQHK